MVVPLQSLFSGITANWDDTKRRSLDKDMFHSHLCIPADAFSRMCL